MTFWKLLRLSVHEIAYIFKQTIRKREVLYREKALIVSSLQVGVLGGGKQWLSYLCTTEGKQANHCI